MSSGSVVVVVLFPFPPTLSKMVASSPVLTFELCQSVLCWGLTGFWGLKFWKWHQQDSWVCIHTCMHTPLTVRMPLLRLNRVTSSASRSVLKLSARALWYISGHLHDIRYPCQSPLPPLKPWHLFAFHVAMKMAWKCFLEEAEEGTARWWGGWCSWLGKGLLSNTHLFLTTTVFVKIVQTFFLKNETKVEQLLCVILSWKCSGWSRVI